jgi:hypothetical protein
MRPLDYAMLGQILGHYRASFITGTTVSIGAAGILGYMRWTDASRYFVLLKLQAAVAVSAAITAATLVDLAAFIARGSTAAGSGGNALTLTGNNQKMRKLMGDTLVSDARVATTAALTRPTGATADSQAFAAAAFPTKVSPDVGATAAATVAVGVASPLVELYKAEQASGEHPVVLVANEHVEFQEVTAGPTTGGLKWYITATWAEVVLF